MAAEAEPNASELMALLERLNTSLDDGERPLPCTAPAPTAEEALGLYYVAARLVELQLHLLEHDDNSAELARQVAVTRDVLVGTRTVLLTALQAMGAGNDAPPSGMPKLRVLHGGRGPNQDRRTALQ
jgi:hypothetical protein